MRTRAIWLASSALAWLACSSSSPSAGPPQQMAPAASAPAGSNGAASPGVPNAAPRAAVPSGIAGAPANPPAATPQKPAEAPAPNTPAVMTPAAPPPAMGMPVGDASEPMPSPGCTGGSLMPGRTMGSIQSTGGNRTFIQYVPDSYDGSKPVPLVVDLHAFSVDATFSESSSGFRPLSDTEGFLYLAPNGLSNMWESVGDSDEMFIRDLVTDIAAKGCVDLRRVYATGCSNGGAFSFLLMCTAEDIFAAVAPMCGTAFFDLDTECMLDRPVPMMLIIGRQDTLNCWEGEGMLLNAPNVPGGTRVPCAKTVQAKLTAKYHCTGEIATMGDCEVVGGCDAQAEVAICGSSTGHVVYTTNTARDTWAFLKRFSKP